MIENNNLSSEVGDTSCWLVLRIRGHISSLNVLNRHVLDIKSNVISWGSFWERLVVHLHRLNLSGQLVGGIIESRASRRVVPLALPSLRSTFHPLYQLMLVLVCNILSPCQPEIGTNGTATGLYPTFLIKPDTSFLISSNLASLYGGSVESILLTATISCFTPRV